MDKQYKTKAWINVASAAFKNLDTFSNKEQDGMVKFIYFCLCLLCDFFNNNNIFIKKKI
jgi:hypothetical protein